MRAALLPLASLACATLDAAADPFPTRDQNPLVATFGLPTPLDARIDDETRWATHVDVNWGSTELLQTDAEGALLVDAETFEARWTLQRTLSERMALQVEIPWRHVGAGQLDGFIDEWHDFFGLPEGARPDLPDNELHIVYQGYGGRELSIEDSHSGLGDVVASLGYEISATQKSGHTLWLSVKLPTGDEQTLMGSGALDASLVFATERQLAPDWSAFGQVGVTWLGQGEVLFERQQRWVWSGLAGIGWRAWRGLELKAQLDAHTAAYDADGLDYLGDAVILTVGGEYRTVSGWRFDAGVSEDLAVEGSPDVVIVLGLRRSW